jgi:hypothetical protein
MKRKLVTGHKEAREEQETEVAVVQDEELGLVNNQGKINRLKQKN